jgi:hypothetical protein
MTMNRLVSFTLIMLIAVIISACASPTQEPEDETINPGDKIGDFVITTGDKTNLDNSEEFRCSQQGEEGDRCEVMVGKDPNVSNGIFDSQYTGKLEEIWSNHTYEMTINDRPVNLQAFGSIDYQHPTVGTVRYWNVVIVADKPGEISVHSKGNVGGKSFEDTTTYEFITP